MSDQCGASGDVGQAPQRCDSPVFTPETLHATISSMTYDAPPPDMDFVTMRLRMEEAAANARQSMMRVFQQEIVDQVAKQMGIDPGKIQVK